MFRPATVREPNVHRYMPVLDGVRGVAVLLVVIHHIYLRAPISHPVDGVFAWLGHASWTGVDLFFVLSGFLITGILLDARESPTYFRAFYWRRLVRIFPLYYAFLAVVFLAVPLAIGQPAFGVPAADQWWFWLYLSNFYMTDAWVAPGLDHLWTLAIEEQFYMVWPAVVYGLGRDRLRTLCLVLLPAVFLLRVVLSLTGTDGQEIYVSTWTRFDTLAAGALLACLARDGGLLRLRPLAWMAVAVSTAAVLWWGGTFEVFGIPFQPPVLVGGLYTPIYALFAGLLVLILTQEGGWTDVFRGRLLPTFGKYSYAVYVLHFPVDTGLRALGLHPSAWYAPEQLQLFGFGLYFVLVSGLSLVAAMLSWHLFEKHFLKLKGRVPYVKGDVAK